MLAFSPSAPRAADEYATFRHVDGLRYQIPYKQLQDKELAKAAITNQQDFDVKHYELTLYPDFVGERIVGNVTIEFTSLIDGLDHLDLDLYANMSVYGTTQQGSSIGHTRALDVLTLQLEAPLAQGEQVSVNISYGGQPEPAGFLGMQFLEHDGVPILATLSEPYFARSWWPCKDVPGDKATLLLRCLAPETYYCASNGVMVDAQYTAGVGVLYTWEETYPIAPYLVSVAVTNYVGWNETYTAPGGETMIVEYRVFPEHLNWAVDDFENTLEMIDLYVMQFGSYPFLNEKYGMAEFVLEGAMEHQTMTSYGDFLITGDKRFERLVGHELAHQWWGNLVTLSDWDDLWLHEGFATYSEALWIEHKQGFASYRTFMRQHSAFGIGFFGPISPPSPLFGGTVYDKGAWVLHMLRHVVGDNDFFQIMRDYAASPALQYDNATIEDFVAIAETVTDSELSWFFDQWLYRTGRPDYDVSWSATPLGESTRIDLTIRQIQAGEIYVMPLDFVIDTDAGSETFTVWNTSAVQTTSFVVQGAPSDVRLDPEDWVLRWNQSPDIVVGAPAARNGLRLLPNYPNPFNPSTTLQFELAAPAEVELRIFDARGRVVQTLVPGRLPAGPHRLPWNGRDTRGEDVASGVYTVRLFAGDEGGVQKITLLK